MLHELGVVGQGRFIVSSIVVENIQFKFSLHPLTTMAAMVVVHPTLTTILIKSLGLLNGA